MGRVLVACEFSGIVRRAFRDRGHEAWSCDLLPAEDGGEHIQGDIEEVLRWDVSWDLMIAHPPCQYLANSGVRWLTRDGVVDDDRWELMREGAAFFRRLWEADIPRIVIENPIPHAHARVRMGGKYTQIVQPWMFGDPFQKATCLWVKGLLPLEPTNIVQEREQKAWKEPPHPDRWKRRSRTYPGLAEAMATQWGDSL